MQRKLPALLAAVMLAIASLQFNPANANFPEAFNTGKILAAHINSLQLDPDAQEALAKSVTPSLYYYILIQPDLYPTTFSLIFNRLKDHIGNNGSSFKDFVSNVDPSGKFIADFIRTISSFDHLLDIFRQTPADANYWTSAFMAAMLKSSERRDANLYYFMPGLEQVFASSDSALKIKFENKLIDSYYLKNNEPETTKFLGIIFFALQNEFSPQNIAKAHSLAAELKNPLSKPWQIPLAEWRKTSDYLTVYLIWHPDQTYFLDVFLSSSKYLGYQPVAWYLVKNQVTGKFEQVIITEKILPNGSFFKGIRIINNVSSAPDIKRIMQNPDIHIVGHRGHNFELLQTFNSDATISGPKLIFLGSCNGFQDVFKISGRLKDNLQFLSSLGVAEGETNTPLLLFILDEMGKGKTDWGNIKKDMPQKLRDDPRAKDFVWPDELPMLLFYNDAFK